LREAIAVLVNVTAGVSCNADQVIVVGGLRDALALSKAVLADRRAIAWIEDPVHPRMRLAVRAAELNAIPIPVDAQGIDVEAALQIEGAARMALVRPAFQFPTGALLSAARSRELTDWARSANALVVEDATECEFSFSKRAVRSLATLEPNHVVHFNSFERTVFPSLRLAYLIAPERLVDAFHRAAKELDAPMPRPSQIVLAEFINAGHFAKHVRRCRDVAEERHAALLASLASLSPALECDRQLGGLHICARLHSSGTDALIGERAAAAGIDAAPLSATYTRRPAMQGLVLGFAAFDPQVITQSVNALARALPSPASAASAP
jgi:GntR family transcriptional regulator/MocR family aminotransferase